MTPGEPAITTSVRTLPFRAPAIGDAVLGLHLRHLRQNRRLTIEDVQRLLPRSRHITPRSLADMEAGRSTLLHACLDGGHGPALAYSSRRAVDDWTTTLLTHRSDRENSHIAAHGAFADTGPGAQHRHQLVEQAATRVVYAVAGDLLPAPLRTEPVRRETLRGLLRLPSVVAALGTPARVRAVSGPGCWVCRLYEAGLPDESARLWQHHVDRARAQAFTIRRTRPGSRTIVLVNEELIRAHARAGAEPWAGQLRDLAERANHTGLSSSVVPTGSGHTIVADRIELRLGKRRIATVAAGLREVTYEELADPQMPALRQVALGHGAGLDLIRRAASGTLAHPW